MHLQEKVPEVGLRIKQSARGKGYGKEMIGGLITWIQANKDCDYILYRAYTENFGSRKIAEHFG
ncbi:MAG: GNAT family N-acetyltransferase [bacterium]